MIDSGASRNESATGINIHVAAVDLASFDVEFKYLPQAIH